MSNVEWSSQEGLNSITVRGELESPIDFKWMPYNCPNVALHGHWISADDIVPSKELQSFARYIHACHLVSMYYDTEKYNPHRVARQLGFDQDCTFCSELPIQKSRGEDTRVTHRV
jgi:hypothetical protein